MTAAPRRRRLRIRWIRGWACRCRCWRVWQLPWEFSRTPRWQRLEHVTVRLSLDTSTFEAQMLELQERTKRIARGGRT